MEYRKSTESACGLIKNMEVSFSSNSASSKASSSESTASSVNCVTLMSVYLPERRLNFQLNRPGPAVLNN